MEEASSLNWSSLGRPVLQLVRESCASLLVANPHVTIDSVALRSYARSLDAGRLHRQPKRMYPLNFPTPRSEINFLCTLALLQVGSGWRRALHAQRGGKGAAETVTFGVMGMHISGEISADAMTRVGLYDVAQLFGLKIQEEYELSPGIHSERATELYSLAQTLRQILNDAGGMLRNLACQDWADFWLKAHGRAKIEEIDEATGEPVRPRADDAVKRLVRHFSALQDAYVLPAKKEAAEAEGAAPTPTPTATATAAAGDAAAAESKEASASSSSSSSSGAASGPGGQRVVYILKKAQLMVSDLERRFGDDPSLPFNFSDMDSLTVFSDNVLPAVLRAQGVLRYSASLGEHVDAARLLTDREQEASIRAAAVVACERIVEEFNAHHAATPDAPRLNAALLDYHLWQAGKEADMRKRVRHATHSHFY